MDLGSVSQLSWEGGYAQASGHLLQLWSPLQMACVDLWVLCHLGLGGGQAEGVGSSSMCRTGSTELMEGGGEASFPAEVGQMFSIEGSHLLHGVLGGHKVLSVRRLLGVTSASCHPEMQGVSVLEQSFPTEGALPSVPRGVFPPGSHLSASAPCWCLSCSV